jgi:hypothetical protein
VALGFLALPLGWGLVQDPAVRAATITVNSTSDAALAAGTCQNVGETCTLRAAVQRANRDAGEDTIVLEAATYKLSVSKVDESAADAAKGGDLDVSGDLVIMGAKPTDAGEPTTIIDAQTHSRIFDLHAGTIKIFGVTLTNGDARQEPDGQFGGAILVRPTAGPVTIGSTDGP